MNEFWFHYVGRGLYSIDNFIKEAKRHGVQRAVPFHMIKKFKWGDRVLLAHWISGPERGKGQAEIFGYFTVESVVTNLPQDVEANLIGNLKVVEIVETKKPIFEHRLCGTYFIGGVAYVDEPLDSLAKKAHSVCRSSGVDPNKYKWFLRGPFRAIPTLVLMDAKFVRGFVRVNIQGLDLEALKNPPPAHSLVWIYDYKQRTYLRKKDLRAFGCETLDCYMGGEA
ncbi:MAG: hypothetical protein QW764_02935 [Desulfurococcaceae archaeon]